MLIITYFIFVLSTGYSADGVAASNKDYDEDDDSEDDDGSI